MRRDRADDASVAGSGREVTVSTMEHIAGAARVDGVNRGRFDRTGLVTMPPAHRISAVRDHNGRNHRGEPALELTNRNHRFLMAKVGRADHRLRSRHDLAQNRFPSPGVDHERYRCRLRGLAGRLGQHRMMSVDQHDVGADQDRAQVGNVGNLDIPASIETTERSAVPRSTVIDETATRSTCSGARSMRRIRHAWRSERISSATAP